MRGIALRRGSLIPQALKKSAGFRSPSIVVGGGVGAADRDESADYGLLVTGSFRLFLTRPLAIESDVTRISSPYTDAEWSVAAGLVARTPPRRVSAFGSGGFSTQGLYFGGGIDVRVAGPLLAYGQARLGPSGSYTWQFIGGIRYVVR